MAEGHAGGAYARLDKTENYVGQALTNLGNVAFRDRQFKQEQDDKVKAQKVAQAKVLQDESNAVKMPDLKTVTSLNSNLERLKTKTASDIAGKVVAIKREIENTQDRGKIADLQGKLSQGNLAFDVLNDFSTKVNDNIKYLVDNKDKIDPDSYDEQMAKYTMAAKGYGQIRLDDNMHPVFDSTDENGNVLKEEGSTNKSLSDFFVNNAQNLMLKSTFNDDLKKVVDDLGKKETVNDVGDKTITNITPTEEAKKVAKENFFKEFLNKKNNRYRFSKDNNLDSKNEEVLKQKVEELFDSKISTTYKNVTNTSELSRLETKRQNAITNARQNVAISSAMVNENYIDETSNTGKTVYVDKNYYLPKMITLDLQNQKPIKNIGVSGSGLNYSFIQGINRPINKGSKDFLITGKTLKESKIKYKGEDVSMSLVFDEAQKGDEEAKKIISSGGADIYNTFSRQITEAELSSLIGGTSLKNVDNVKKKLRELNPNTKRVESNKTVEKETPEQRKARLYKLANPN